MNLVNMLINILNFKKKINLQNLPSQGLFYKEGFEINIKKASKKYIKEYEDKYIAGNLGVTIQNIKEIVKKCIIIRNGFTFEDIKSIDIVFLFIEIVRLTKNKEIPINYINEKGENKEIFFNSKNFNYYKVSEEIMRFYNKNEKYFEIYGYKYSLPSIGVETCLTDFLVEKSTQKEIEKYNNYFYDFTFFLGDKNNISFIEIDNLIEIFNFDIDDIEADKINKIIETFIPLQKYSLIKDGNMIEINSKINLEKIWK